MLALASVLALALALAVVLALALALAVTATFACIGRSCSLRSNTACLGSVNGAGAIDWDRSHREEKFLATTVLSFAIRISGEEFSDWAEQMDLTSGFGDSVKEYVRRKRL